MSVLSGDELRAAITAAMHVRPNAAGRAQLLYDITRAGYDAIKTLNGDTDTDERFSAAKVSDEALAHQDRMDACTTQ